jgi:hypothetical protein
LIEFTVGDTSFIVELMDEKAPKTCDGIWNALPLESDMHHAKFAGEEVFFEFSRPITDPRASIENLGYLPEMKAGQISSRGAMMVICYGRMENERFTVNLIGQVTEDTFEDFRDSMIRAFRNPGEKILIRKKV